MVSKPVNGEKEDDESCTFSNWREFNIHDDGDDDDDNKNNGNIIDENGEEEEEEEDTAYLFRLFDTEDDDDIYEDVPYEYPMPMSTSTSMTEDDNDDDNDNEKGDATNCTKIVTIRHHSAYPNSTGLAVWRGAEILARYLCVCEQQLLLQQKVGIKADNSESKTTDFIVQVQNKKVLELGAGAGKFLRSKWCII
jgi:hypothetical protein